LANPPKSCIVYGFDIAVTETPAVYQCADIHKIVFGLGKFLANFYHTFVYELFYIAFVGDPCPINKAGINS
jgi:hypothetical protein